MEVIHTTNTEMCNTINKNGCYITEDGTKHYYKNNGLHRLDGPASEWKGNKYWYRKGFIHRIGGSAVEFYNGSRGWFLFDRYYSEDEYNKLVSNLPLFYWKNRDKLWK